MPYFNATMQISQQPNTVKFYCRATGQQRLIAGIICLFIIGVFGVLSLVGTGAINVSRWIGVCGFKQRYNLPCPSCSMTTAAIAFVQGKFLESFYIQPAAALLCALMVFSAVLAFLTACFGVYFSFVDNIFNKANIKYIVLALLVIIAAGWAVTLARALALLRST
jgi:hypothetical protein